MVLEISVVLVAPLVQTIFILLITVNLPPNSKGGVVKATTLPEVLRVV